MTRTYPIPIPYEELAEFCRTNGIRKLSFFGSIVRHDFTSESDIDVLVEFEEGRTPGFRYFGIQEELAGLLGRKVDLLTPASLSTYYRDEVLRQAEVVYDPACPSGRCSTSVTATLSPPARSARAARSRR